MGTIELTKKIRELKELQIFIKQLEEEEKTIKALVIAEMENRQIEKLNIDVFTVRYTTVQSTRLDTSKLKKELSDVYNTYSKTTESKRFQIS